MGEAISCGGVRSVGKGEIIDYTTSQDRTLNRPLPTGGGLCVCVGGGGGGGGGG